MLRLESAICYRVLACDDSLCRQTLSDKLDLTDVGRGGDTVGNPHRAQIAQFELFELILLFQVDRQFPVEQFEAKLSQPAVPSPLLRPLRGHAKGRRSPPADASGHHIILLY